MLAELIHKNHISLYRLSKETEIPYSTLSDLVSEKTSIHNVSAETLYKLSRHLHVSMESLYEGKSDHHIFYLYNKERMVYLQGCGLKISYLGPKNLLSFHRLNRIEEDVACINTYFVHPNGQIFEEEDYLDLRDLLKEYGQENYLNSSYELIIGSPSRSRKERLIDEALLVTDNLAFLYSENSLDEVQVEIINLSRNNSCMRLRMNDYAILGSNMSDKMQQRALFAARRNAEQINHEVKELKAHA